MPDRNAETELEETEKIALIARQRGEHSGLGLKDCVSCLGAGSEASYSV